MQTLKQSFSPSISITHLEPTIEYSKHNQQTQGQTTTTHAPRETTQRETPNCPKNQEQLNKKQKINQEREQIYKKHKSKLQYNQKTERSNK